MIRKFRYIYVCVFIYFIVKEIYVTFLDIKILTVKDIEREFKRVLSKLNTDNRTVLIITVKESESFYRVTPSIKYTSRNICRISLVYSLKSSVTCHS